MSRPRPRLVSRQAKGPEIQPAKAVQDEDDHFRRNRGRTAQHWKQLEQYAAKAAPSSEPVDESDDPSDDGSSPRPRKKKKQNRKDDRLNPRWQRTEAAKLLSSDNDDDDVQIIENASANPRDTPSPNKRKRERSRSKSLTPPPELPAHQRANAMNLVRQALAVPPPRPPSPTCIPDAPTDTIDLDPELAKIAESVRKQMQNARLEPEPEGGPEAVTIKVLWRPHPLNTSAKEESWMFKMRRNDTFRELFEELADLAGVLVEQLVVSHDHRRVFASGTPHSLHIWASGELEACDKHTDEYIRNNRNNPAPSPALQDITSEQSPSAEQYSDAESEAEGRGDTIKLIFRSAATKDKTFPLTVRSTTTCGAIVKAFLKAAELPDKYSNAAAPGKTGKKGVPFPQLMIDGDKMAFDAEIGDAGLEDGDLVEVVGV